MLTREIYEKLKPLERNLKLAVFSNSYTGLFRTETQLLIDVYNTQYKENKKNTACNRCILNMLQRLGKEYLQYQEQQNNDTKTEKKNGKGRKKKSV